MDNTAIEQIQSSANVEELAKQLEGTDIPLALIPKTHCVESLESKMKYASRYRMRYETSMVSQFVSYSLNYVAEGVNCFVDSDSMSAKIVFDMGTVDKPLHQAHSAKVKLKKLAAYKALLSIQSANEFREEIDQKKAAEFIEDWSQYLTILDQDGSEIDFKVAVKAIKDMTLESYRASSSQIDSYSESMSISEKHEAKNAHLLPTVIMFKCSPYLEFEEREFAVRINVNTTGRTPKFNFRVTGLEEHQEQIALEFQSILIKAFSSRPAYLKDEDKFSAEALNLVKTIGVYIGTF